MLLYELHSTALHRLICVIVTALQLVLFLIVCTKSKSTNTPPRKRLGNFIIAIVKLA